MTSDNKGLLLLLLDRFSFLSQEPVVAVFGLPVPKARTVFFLDTSDLRTVDLMILRMRVIFQADEKHVIQVFC